MIRQRFRLRHLSRRRRKRSCWPVDALDDDVDDDDSAWGGSSRECGYPGVQDPAVVSTGAVVEWSSLFVLTTFRLLVGVGIVLFVATVLLKGFLA